MIVNITLLANRELVIPRIAPHLQTRPGMDDSAGRRVDPVHDFASHVVIGGKELYVGERKLRDAEFILPAPNVTQELTTLRAREAFFHRSEAARPGGWHLKGVTPTFSEINLAESGKKLILPVKNSDELFVVTDVSFDQLYNRNTSHIYLSTRELMRRSKNPAFGIISLRGQTLHLHQRLTQPVVNVIAVFLVVPLIIRKEATGPITSIAICASVLGLVFAFAQLALYLGRVNVIAPDLAAWLPIVLSGTLGAWLSGIVQT